ncbi:MAG: hypothetical protein ACR2OE_00215 [Thermomicrobiales bacterium]
MLTNNLDMLAVAVAERQLQLQFQVERSRALPHVSGPIRRTIGRFLVWSGHQVGGNVEAPPAPAQSLAPVLPFSPRQPHDDLELAA